MFPKARPESVIFVTVDSCRYDVFTEARIPNLRAVGPIHRTMAPSHYTYASHASMFMGFTPGDAQATQSFINPMYGKIFKMKGGGFSGKGEQKFILKGKNVIDGFKNRGYLCLGSGAVNWFNPEHRTGQALTMDFHQFYFPGDTWFLEKQLNWFDRKLQRGGRPVFVFINIGETHFPYYHEGASWSKEYNPCRPMDGDRNDAGECRRRQKACLEFVDAKLAPLLESFANGNTIICADHGDCWGEDGLWGHGMHHEKALEVPLIFRLTPDCDSESPLFQKMIESMAWTLQRTDSPPPAP